MSKLVSVIIPTYSRPDFISRAIESVLNQTYKPIEIIVVDDNGRGTNNQILTEQVLTNFIRSNQIKYIVHEKNKNGSAARNTGAASSHGEYITFLDDDDVLLPQKIEKQVNAIEQNPTYAAAYTGFKIIRNSKTLKEVIPTKKGCMHYEMLALTWGIGTGSNPLYKKNAFDAIGGFDESFTRHQDLELLVRFFRNNSIINIPEVLIERNIDSRINSVNYEKFATVKNKFLSTFEKDIQKYPIKMQNIIYRNHYADVACHAMQAKAYRVAFRYYAKANSYKTLSLRIIAKAILYGFMGREVE